MKNIGLILLILLATGICAQENPVEIANQDSQAFAAVLPDSLNTQPSVIDSLKENIDPKLLLTEMNNFLDEKRKMEVEFFIPQLIYNENFHLSSPFNLNVHIKKNGFSEIPFSIGNLQIIQNNQNIYNTTFKRGNVFYNSFGYSLPVAITETYMGLGDIDMNNISVSLMKGGILGIPKLSMQLDFLGEKGKWLGYEDEASQNLHLNLCYDFGFSKVHFNSSFIDQTLPGEKDIFSYQYPFNSIINKEKEYSVTFENKILDLGLKYKLDNYELVELFNKDRDLIQAIAKKRFQTINHLINFSYEFVSEDIVIDDFSNSDTTLTVFSENYSHILSGDHESNILGFNIGNTGYYQDENNFQFDSEISKYIFKGFGIFGEYNTSSNEYSPNYLQSFLRFETRSRIGGGILFDPSFFKSKITIGKHIIEGFEGGYFDVKNELEFMLADNLELDFKLWLRNERTTIISVNDEFLKSYPEWQILDDFELIYHLKYDNAIKLGLKHTYHSNFSYTLDDLDMIFTNDTNNIDAYLKIQLTNRFEISLDAINLTNNPIMFINSDHPGTHFNFNVHWIFAN